MSRTTWPGTHARTRHLRLLPLAVAALFASCEPGTPTDPMADADDSISAAWNSSSPSKVTDLAVASLSDTSVTLRWTAVSDGRSQPALYEMKYAPTPIGWGWGSATKVTTGPCAAPIAAGAIGSVVSCEILGLSPETSYDVQVVAYRQTTSGKVFSALSNVATGVTYGVPRTVADLSVAGTTDATVTLQFTEVSDGNGGAASYEVRYAPAPIGWGSAAKVTDGECANPVAGSTVGSVRTCSVNGLQSETGYDFQMVSFREDAAGNRAFSDSLSNVASGATAATVTAPSSVTDLSVAGTTETSVTLRFTEVSNGAGGAASYEVRFAPTPIGWGWGTATIITEGECATPVSGTSVGAVRTCAVTGLQAGTSYDFQIASFREEDSGPVFAESLSNFATAVTTGASEPAPVASVEVSPASLALEVGGTGQLSAVLRDSAGNVLTGRNVTWQSSNPLVASVSTAGLVTARSAGTVELHAESEGIAGSADVTVTLGGGTGSHPHEPAGFTMVTDRAFDAILEDGWSVNLVPEFSIAPDPTAPESPSNVGQALFPAGLESGLEPIATEKDFGSHGFTRLYVSFWIKISDNWQSHTVGNKIGYMFIHNNATAFAIFVPAANNSLQSQIRLQSTPDGINGAQIFSPNLKDVPILRGAWQQWEILFVSNTGDDFNGEVHWWIDGQKAGEYRNMRFGNASQSDVWHRVSWRPVWGGGPAQTVLENQFMWMDNYYASGSR